MLVDATMRGIKDFYEPGYRLAKAGVILMGLSPRSQQHASLLDDAPPPVRNRSALMETMDQINARWGKGTVGVAGARQSAGWERKTPNYTASVESMPSAN